MENATKSVLHRDYSNLAADYDRQRFESTNGRFLARTDAAILNDLLQRTHCKKVVDVPCGTGRVFEYLQDFAGSITGCDLTPQMCDIARTKIANQRQLVVLGDASSLPFPDNDFDALISLRFFHLFAPSERIQFAAEYARVVRPGGWILCSFTNGWYGGGINWLRRGLGRPTVQFQYQGELKRLFPGWTTVAVRGNFLPLQWRLANANRYFERLLRWGTFYTPIKYLCWERFYLLRKPE